MVDLTYQASVEPEALPGRAYPRLPDEVSPQAYGSQVGQGIEQAADQFQRVHDEVQQQARSSMVTDFHNKLQGVSNTLTHDPNTGAFAQLGQNGFDLQNRYLPQFDQQVQPLLAAIPDPKARQAAMQTAAQMRTQLSEQLDTHELAQHKEFGIQTAKASVDLAQQAGPANYNHPDILASNLDTIQYSIGNLGKQQGWAPEQIQLAQQQATSAFHSNVIDRMLADDKIGMAQTYLDTAKNGMDANTAWRAQRTIDAQQKEVDNEKKQDIADRYNDSIQAAQFGLKNPITVSRAELNILYPKDAQRRWDGLQMMAGAAAQAKDFDGMKPEDIQKVLDAKKPTVGGPEATFAISSYETLARAAQQSIASRNQDPAQFAIDSGAGWKPLDLKNAQNAMDQLKSRANTQEQVSDQTGVNTPLLTKTETQAFTSWLGSQPPAQRLQTLAQLRTTLPSDVAYSALLKQIAPQSPLTAIAGTTLDRPTINAPSWYNPKFSTDPMVGQRILEGEAILRDKGEKGIKSTFPMPSDKDLQSQFQSAIGGSNSDLFRGRDQTLEAYYAAYKAAYAAEANQEGRTDGVIHSDIAQKAAEMVIGHATTYGHTSLVVPSGMDPTRFEGTVDKASHSALEAGGYSESDIAALRGYGLRELGDTLGTGRYVVINGNGDPLKSKSGANTVIVDLNKFRSQHTSVYQDPTPPPHPHPVKGGSNISVQ